MQLLVELGDRDIVIGYGYQYYAIWLVDTGIVVIQSRGKIIHISSYKKAFEKGSVDGHDLVIDLQQYVYEIIESMRNDE